MQIHYAESVALETLWRERLHGNSCWRKRHNLTVSYLEPSVLYTMDGGGGVVLHLAVADPEGGGGLGGNPPPFRVFFLVLLVSI